MDNWKTAFEALAAKEGWSLELSRSGEGYKSSTTDIAAKAYKDGYEKGSELLGPAMDEVNSRLKEIERLQDRIRELQLLIDVRGKVTAPEVVQAEAEQGQERSTGILGRMFLKRGNHP